MGARARALGNSDILPRKADTEQTELPQYRFHSENAVINVVISLINPSDTLTVGILVGTNLMTPMLYRLDMPFCRLRQRPHSA